MHIVAAATDTWSADSEGSYGSTGMGEATPTETLLEGSADGPAVPQAFLSIPGPKVTDCEAYNARNHQYILELHEQYGDMVAAEISSMARADTSEPSKRVVFVRNPYRL